MLPMRKRLLAVPNAFVPLSVRKERLNNTKFHSILVPLSVRQEHSELMGFQHHRVGKYKYTGFMINMGFSNLTLMLPTLQDALGYLLLANDLSTHQGVGFMFKCL
jgi:hypothetical protein